MRCLCSTRPSQLLIKVETLSAALSGFSAKAELETPSIWLCWFNRIELFFIFYSEQVVLGLGANPPGDSYLLQKALPWFLSLIPVHWKPCQCQVRRILFPVTQLLCWFHTFGQKKNSLCVIIHLKNCLSPGVWVGWVEGNNRNAEDSEHGRPDSHPGGAQRAWPPTQR